MAKYLFVGDRPSKRNTDPKIAFAGTVSGKTLNNWFRLMNIDVKDVELANSTDEDIEAKVMSHVPNPVVALGVMANKRLEKLFISRNMLWFEWFHLPHPSGRNRLLNKARWLEDRLNQCKLWLEEQDFTSSEIKSKFY